MTFPELEDFPWFPPVLRRMQTEYIGWLVHRFGVYRPLAPVVAGLLQQAGVREVVDLGAGNGGPSRALAAHPALEGVSFVLTDLYPSVAPTGSEQVRWHHEPVNALEAPDTLGGLRVMFNAYHHFSEENKRLLVENAGRYGLFVAEVLQPTVWCFLKILVTTTLGQVLLAPLVFPFRWSRLFFTWLVPVNVFTVTWDGLASVVNVDHPRVLHDRARAFAPGGCETICGVSGSLWAPVAWFCVLPAAPEKSGVPA